MDTDNIEMLLNFLNITLTKNIINDISFYLNKCNYTNNHVSFIVDANTRQVIFHKFNVFYKSNQFPYSSHSEVEGVKHFLKKYKTRHNYKIIFIVIKITKTGKIGNSKPCKHCANFLYNHLSNMNIDKIFYSTPNNCLVNLDKDSLRNNNFKLSSGFSRRSD